MSTRSTTTRPRRCNAEGSGPDGLACGAKPHPTAADAPRATLAPERLAYRINEVARMFGVSRRTIERETSAGRFPEADVKVGKARLWGRDALVAWIAGGGGR